MPRTQEFTVHFLDFPRHESITVNADTYLRAARRAAIRSSVCEYLIYQPLRLRVAGENGFYDDIVVELESFREE